MPSCRLSEDLKNTRAVTRVCARRPRSMVIRVYVTFAGLGLKGYIDKNMIHEIVNQVLST